MKGKSHQNPTLVRLTDVSMMYKLALKSALYDFTAARDFYREATRAAGIGMHHELTIFYIKLQALVLTPIAPHWSEYIWLDVLDNSHSIQTALFPVVLEQKPALTAARDYVRWTSSNITSAEGAQQKKLAKGKTLQFDPTKDKKLTIFVAHKFPAWQDKCVQVLKETWDGAGSGATLDAKALSQKFDKTESKKAMPFVNALKRRLENGESAEGVFERKLAFDELAVLKEMVPGLRQSIPKCRAVEIVNVEEGGRKGKVVGGDGGKDGEDRNELPQMAETAQPGSPSFQFENIDA